MKALFSGIFSAITTGIKILLFMLWIASLSSAYRYQGLFGFIYGLVFGVLIIWFLGKKAKSAEKQSQLETMDNEADNSVLNSTNTKEEFIAHGEFLKSKFSNKDFL